MVNRTSTRVKICLVAACLLLAGPFMYYDLALGIRLLSTEALQTIWILSALVSMFFLADYTKNKAREMFGCLLFGPIALLTIVLLVIWCKVDPIKEKESRKEGVS